jgi:4-amino-4-deoxy-L-arabinose transferase-like glycosyltransferase
MNGAARPPAWLWGLLLASTALGLLPVPLFDVDEGAFAQATLEMLASGNYAATTLYGEPRYDKPILSYWLQAASVSLFGVQEWAFRLPSLLAALAWALAGFRFAAELYGPRVGAQAAALLVTALWTSLIARAAIADALLNLFIALALFDLYRHHLRPGRALRLRIALWLALGFLTKGPVAVAVPLLASGLFAATQGRAALRQWALGLLDLRAAAVFVLGVLPWLVAVYRVQGWGFFEGFFGEHNLRRFADTREGHGGSPFYYLVVFPILVLPFTTVALRLLRQAGLHWREPFARYALMTFALVFALGSASATQLPHYLLYGMSPLLVLMARSLERLRPHWTLYLPLALFLALLAALPVALQALDRLPLGAFEQALLADAHRHFGPGYAALLLLAVAAAVGAVRALRLSAGPALLVAGAVQLLFVHGVLLPRVAAVQQGPVVAAAAVARASTAPLVMFATHQPSFAVYAGRPVRRGEPLPGDWAFARAERARAFCAARACRFHHEAGGYALFEPLASED